MIKKYIKFFIFACICFMIADYFVNADELDKFIVPSGAQFYDNTSGTLNAITTDYVSNAGDKFYMSYSIHTIPSSSGAAISFNLNEPLIAGYVYTISVSVGPTGCGETRLSSLNRIGIGGSFNGAKNAYQNGGNATIKFSDYQVAGQGYKGLSYAFTPSTNGTYIVIPYTTANNCTDVNYFYGYTINNLGSANNVSQQDINNSINNQTTIINNSINNVENNIQNSINESANNTDSNIINSSNATQDSINNGLQNCTKQFKYTLKKGKGFDENGNLSDNSDSYYTEKYYSLSGATKLTISNTGLSYPDFSGYIIIYNSNKQYLDFWSIRDTTFNLPEGASYYRLSTEMSGVTLYEGDGCTSKLDSLEDSITSDEAPETPDFSDLDVADDSVISDLVTMPITIAEHILDAFNDTCSNYTIPFFNNTTLTLPCFTIGDYVGDNVVSVIDLAIILFMIYNIAMLAISAFNDLTSLRDSYDSLYVPQHGPHSYEPRHGKE